ncbi:MAG: hypothetical protein ACTSRW_02020 [Candidatus Helarchaeota archaeon]
MLYRGINRVFNIYWNNMKFRVRVLKEIPVISEDGKVLNVLSPKTETTLEFWKVKKFLHDERIEVLHPKIIDISDLDRVLWKEENNTELQKLEQSFYLLTNYLIEESLKEANKEKLESFEKGRQIKNLIETIIERRSYKILKIITLKEAEKFVKKLTFEEKELFRNLSLMYDTWKQNIWSFFSN